ncbi:MAG TPA: methylenetetrahydrofolate reductase [Acidimicrobiales bacterium]|nr:methylenetetrahydrofolate reductase [Acidimicrobiales bacterium]
MPDRPFEIVCEVEPATRPDLRRVRHQIGVLTPIASAFLIPDNHLGRSTVSSVAVAHEVAQMGGRSIACLNARDRNLLGFRRDLLTAAAYGVQEFLFVYGDKPEVGGRSDELTVRSMIDETRATADNEAFAGHAPFRVGATSRLTTVPKWKQEADFLFVQAGFSVDAFVHWRQGTEVDIPVYAGVLVLASQPMALRLRASTPEIDIPDELVDRLADDRDAGVTAACELVDGLRASGAFEGVHLVPVGRYREVASRLEPRPSP